MAQGIFRNTCARNAARHLMGCMHALAGQHVLLPLPPRGRS